MADVSKDLQQMLSTLLEASRRDAQITDLLGSIKQALVDGVSLLEQKAAAEKMEPKDGPDLAAALAGLKFPAPVVNFPAAESWTSLRVDAPVDSMGRPTGTMTITKVR